MRRRHTVGGTKDFGAALSIVPDNNKKNSGSNNKIDDEEKENEKALRRMSLPVEDPSDEEEFDSGPPKSQCPKVLVSQV